MLRFLQITQPPFFFVPELIGHVFFTERIKQCDDQDPYEVDYPKGITVVGQLVCGKGFFIQDHKGPVIT